MEIALKYSPPRLATHVVSKEKLYKTILNFQQKSYWIISIHLNKYIDIISSSFPSGISAERTLSFCYNIRTTDYYISFPLVSIFCGFPIWQLFFRSSSLYENFIRHVVPKVVTARRVDWILNLLALNWVVSNSTGLLVKYWLDSTIQTLGTWDLTYIT